MKTKTKKIILTVIASLLFLALVAFICIKLYINKEIEKVTEGNIYKIGSSVENLLNNGDTFHFNITNTVNSADGVDIVIYEGDVKINSSEKSLSVSMKYSNISSTDYISQSYIIYNNTLIVLDDKKQYVQSYDITNYVNTLFEVLGEFKNSNNVKTVSDAQNIANIDWKKIFNSTGNSMFDYIIPYDKFGECVQTLFSNYNNEDYLVEHIVNFRKTNIDNTTTYLFVISPTIFVKDVMSTLAPAMGAVTAFFDEDKIYNQTDKVETVSINVSTENDYFKGAVLEYKVDSKNTVISTSISNIGTAEISQQELENAYSLHIQSSNNQ